MTPTDESRFIALWQEGASPAEIAQALGIALGTVGSRASTLQRQGKIQARPRGDHQHWSVRESCPRMWTVSLAKCGFLPSSVARRMPPTGPWLSEAPMTRRTIGLLVTLALTVLVAPLQADAQQPTKVYHVGRLSSGSPPEVSPFVYRTAEAFRHGLRALGYVEGQNLALTWRFAEGRLERLPALAAELVRLPVDVLVVSGGDPVIRAAQQATQTIPIVVAGVSDPVSKGFVASLAHPGGNLTGLDTFSVELAGKRLELLKEQVPTLTRLAILANPAHSGTARHLQEAQASAHALGVQPHLVEVRSPDAFEPALAALTSAGVDALLVLTDPLTFEPHISAIVALAQRSRLPAMYPWRAYVEAGGLMAYGASLPDIHRRAASYVDKILKGAKPADLPVEQPREFDFVINLKTARELGLTIPQQVLIQATEVIQ